MENDLVRDPVLAEGRLGNGSLFKSLLFPLLALVILVGILGAVWTGRIRAREELEHLRRTLASNAQMMDQLNLPVSEKMSEYFSTAMGRSVAFVRGENLIGAEEWSEGERELARRVVSSGDFYEEDSDWLVVAHSVPRRSGTCYLVASQGRSWMLDRRSWSLLLPIIPIGALAAYWVARKIARPIQNLAIATAHFPENYTEGSGELMPSELTVRRDEIGVLARTLVGARERIASEIALRERSERLAMLGQIATGLAHDIKNPASSIIMHSELLGDVVPDEARMIKSEAEDIVGLVNQWLYTAQPTPPRLVEQDLAVALRKLLGQQMTYFNYHGVGLEVSIPESCLILCDRERLMHTVRNLIQNSVTAMQAAGEGSLLVVGLDVGNGEVCLSVRDNGRGFSEDALRNFGEPFYSEKEGGMGLGLAMAKGVVEAHGGAMSVENLKQGAVMCIVLPVI
ncbi:MAG: ATP-binding protein [Akkermansiaceae bacterium]